MNTEIQNILLIMNCTKYRDKALYQKKTWLSTLDDKIIPYYHVIGDPLLNKEFSFDVDERILWVKTMDDYNSLPKKVISAYQAVYETFNNIKYIFKTDDDQMLQSNNPDKFFNNIFKLLEKKNQDVKIHYAGNIVDVPQPYLSQYHRIHPELPKELPVYKTRYCSGRFYILSQESISDLLSKREKIDQEYLEDYAIGFYLDEKYKTSMLFVNSNLFFKDMETITT